MIAIVDYGMGNLGSIANMLRGLEVECAVTSDPSTIRKASKLILPGVGAFDAAMERINSSPLRSVLDEVVQGVQIPVLGICLGMQLLTRSSEEGKLPGLGWIEASTLAFATRIGRGLKVPHMGWNLVHPGAASALTRGLEGLSEPRFYFVHSYFVSCDDSTNSVLKTNYGICFDSAVQRGHIYGVQFHPEKSHRFGKALLANFASM